MIEIDLQTRMTIVTPDTDQRGGTYFAARVNKLIRDALERDGFVFKVSPGRAEPIACVTDLYRMEYNEDDDA